MAQNTNRLSLSNMVDSNLKNTVLPTESFFDPEFLPAQVVTPKPPKTSFATSLNSIFASVHNKLRNRKVSKKVVPPTPEVIEIKTESSVSLPAKTSIIKTSSHLNNSSKQESRAKFSRGLHHLNSSLRGMSIPQMKANWDQKYQQRVRRTITRPNDTNNFTSQQRIVEVLRQKRILQEMLLEHQKLQRDRQSIASEIKAMRNYLHDIRDKLDSSLKKLSSKKSSCDRYPIRQKNAFAATRNIHNANNRSKVPSQVLNTMKSKAMPKNILKTGVRKTV